MLSTVSKPTQKTLKEHGVKLLFPVQYLSYNSVFDGKDLIGQARRVEWRRGGVKCVWDEVTDLEFVADETCVHFRPLMSLPKILNFKEQKNSFHTLVFIWS